MAQSCNHRPMSQDHAADECSENTSAVILDNYLRRRLIISAAKTAGSLKFAGGA